MLSSQLLAQKNAISCLCSTLCGRVSKAPTVLYITTVIVSGVVYFPATWKIQHCGGCYSTAHDLCFIQIDVCLSIPGTTHLWMSLRSSSSCAFSVLCEVHISVSFRVLIPATFMYNILHRQIATVLYYDGNVQYCTPFLATQNWRRFNFSRIEPPLQAQQCIRLKLKTSPLPNSATDPQRHQEV